MPSRIPEPMSVTQLRQYRWRESLPVLGAGIPVIDLTPRSGNFDVTIQMGESTQPYFFARSKIAGLPDIFDNNGRLLPDIGQKIWGYAQAGQIISYLGPVVVAQENHPVEITWINKLPNKHPFVHPMPDLAAPGSMMGRYSVGHAAVHMHGARVEEGCDGYPVRKPTKPNPKTVLRPGESETYEYPNEQPGGATLWYHDHAMDMTARNVYAGLAGGYILRHEKEGIAKETPNIPKGGYEIPLIIQDRSFTAKGELLYGDVNYLAGRIEAAQRQDRKASRALTPPSPEFKGHAISVNGKLWPTLDVEPCAYRFRVYNGANSRMFVLRLSSQMSADEANLGVGGEAATMCQIGSDGGVFRRVVELNGKLNVIGQPTTDNFLVLAPGERADVIVDFSTVAGKTVFLTNHATNDSPLGNGGDSVSDPSNDPMYNANLSHVLQIKVVKALSAGAVTNLTTDKLNADLKTLKPANQPVSALNAERRRYVLEEFSVPFTNDKSSRQWKAITIRAVDEGETYPQAHKPGMLWGGQMPDVDHTELQPDGTTQYILQPSGVPNGGPAMDSNDLPPPTTGDVEIWEIYNISPDVHPIHLHLVNFLVMSREPIAIDASNNIVPDIAPRPIPSKVDANENLGWKDTVRANPLEKLTLLVSFCGDSPQGKDYSGDFVWHCHLIEHEDMGMMRPLKVNP